jgi:imidazolonepropionase-like amidohydrolase
MRLPAAALFALLFLSGIVAMGQGPLVLQGGRVYPSPTASPIENAAVVIEGGKIVAVGPSAVVKTPKGARVIDCRGKVIVAGFWNSHVHFESGWEDVPHGSAEKLEAHMQEMLTRWGFTTVWDLGSVPSNTLALRERIARGEIGGPQILMAGDIFPLNGHPVYLPAEMKLPEAASPLQSEQMAQGYLKMGLDGIKLFTGAFMGDKPVVNMDTAIVKAAVDVAHAQGKPVFSHPQNGEGQDNALAGGVDVMAHTIPTEGPLHARGVGAHEAATHCVDSDADAVDDGGVGPRGGKDAGGRWGCGVEAVLL